MKTTTTRLLSVLLCLAMIFVTIPHSILAQISETLNNTTATEERATDSTSVYVLGEVIDNRTETSKTFRMSDGSFIAADYGQVIHYAGEDGAWTDYDNTLAFSEAASSDSEDMAGYGNNGSNLRIKLANNSNSNNLVKLTMGNYKISLHLVGANKSKALEVYPAMEDPAGNDIDSAATLHKFSSGAIYEDILPDVDLEYIISGGSVKENIIIKDTADSYTYTFELKLHGLVPEVDSQGNILLKDETTSETQLVIPAGYMYDANGAYSDAVTYSIAHKNGKKYTLTVTADADWINADDRAFPVTVDPTVEAITLLPSEIDYIYYQSIGVDENEDNFMVVGYGHSDGSQVTHSILRPPASITQNSALKDDSRILSAMLNLMPFDFVGTKGSIEIGAYEIVDNISEVSLDSITWSNAPKSSNVPCDTAIAKKNVELKLNITSIVRNWITSGIPNGLMLKPVEPSPNDALYVKITTNNSPVLIINYDTKDDDDLGSWENYGGIGPISISANTYNGNLQLNMSDLSSSGTVLDIDIQHIHSSKAPSKSTPANPTYAMKFGNGWTLNFLEAIYVDYPNRTVTHRDALGNETCYKQDAEKTTEDADIYTVANGLSYFELIVYDDITFHDGYGGKKVYDIVSHKLLSIIDKYGNSANFNYSDSKLVSISFVPKNGSVSEIITFAYGTNNVLTGISNNITGESVAFEYASTPGGSPSASATTYLKRATYNSGKKYSFIYNSDGTVSYIMDITNDVYERFAYITYVNRSVPVDDNQPAVSSIDLYTSKGRAAAYSFEYHPNLTITTANGVKLYSAFDNQGNTIRQYYTNASYMSYPLKTFCTTNLYQNDKLRYQAFSEGYDNVVLNSHFTARNFWNTGYGGTYTSQNVLGFTSDVMQITGDRQKIRFSVQTVDGDQLGAGTTFLLSGWVKAADSLPINDSRPFSGTSLGLSMVVYYSDASTEEFRVNATTGYDDWQYISTIIVLKESAALVDRVNVYCSYDYNATSSFAYFDEINLSPVNVTQYTYNDDGTISSTTTQLGTDNYTYEEGLVKSHSQTYTNSSETSNTSYSYTDKKDVRTVTSNRSQTTYTYDQYGNISTTTVTDLVDYESIVTGQTYNINQDNPFIVSTDERGKTSYYYYDNMYNLIRTVDPEQNEIRYIYDYQETANGPYKDIVYLDKNKNETRDTNEPYIELTKNTVDKTKVDSVLSNGTEYVYEYDVDNNITSIGIQGITSKLATYTYNAKNQVTSKTLGNGFTESYTYNALDNISQISYNASGTTQTLRYTYYADGMLETVTDSATGKTETYTYDRYNQITKVTLTDSTTTYLKVEYEYDTLGRVTRIVETCSGYSNTYSYTYREASEIVLEVTINNTYRIEYDYDWLDRLQKQTLIKLSNNAEIDSIEYSYVANGENTTRYVSTVSLGSGTLTYTYTNNGYISTVYDSLNKKTVEYFYDANGQLVRENNQYLGKTIIYTYDLAGNITSRSLYALCLGPLGPVLETKTYSYGVGNRLTSLNGVTITYDNAGNPLTWPGYSLSWNGSQLLSCYNACPIAFTYDSLGLRTSKISYGSNTTTTYFRDANGRLIREKRVSNLDQSEVNLVYQYDASGAIIGFTYHPSSGTSSQYFFGKNAQGDVLCIYDANGTLMAGYYYDAWGACTIAYDNTSIGIANINPIRYRSYYYDVETGWYYLQSRYYDPAVGRFISPDDPSLLGANGDLLSYNLYAYCSNNPVNYSDPSGHFVLSTFLLCIGIGAVVGGTLGGITAAANNQNILTGILTGMALGGAAGAIIGIGGAALSGALSSTIGKTFTDIISVSFYGGNFGSWEDYLIAFVFGGVSGSLDSVIAKGGRLVTLSKRLKSASDVAVRPLCNQLVKAGTRGSSINLHKLLYDSIYRGATYFGSNQTMTATVFGQNLKLDPLKCFYRATCSSLYQTI